MSERYKYYFTPGPKVICTSTYAGRTVRGVAICSDKDEFDMEKGKALAKARVDLKIADKRLKRASQKCDEASENLMYAELYADRMLDYRDDAADEYLEAKARLVDLLATY